MYLELNTYVTIGMSFNREIVFHGKLTCIVTKKFAIVENKRDKLYSPNQIKLYFPTSQLFIKMVFLILKPMLVSETFQKIW